MKIYAALTKIKVNESISPEIMHAFITDAAIMLLLLITVLQILS